MTARLGVAALVLATSVACSPATDPEPPAPTESEPAVVFTSLAELARHSSVVAVVEVTSTSVVETQHGVTATVISVTVVRGLRGAVVGDLLKVRQSAPSLTAGPTYLLFLDLFKWSEVEVTDQYTVTGGSGQFQQTAPGTYESRDPLADELPDTVTEAEAVAAVAAAPYGS